MPSLVFGFFIVGATFLDYATCIDHADRDIARWQEAFYPVGYERREHDGHTLVEIQLHPNVIREYHCFETGESEFRLNEIKGIK